jgi:hypothetical protein
MTTEALIWMVTVQGSVTVITIWFLVLALKKQKK